MCEKECKFQNCAVCAQFEEREIFKNIYGMRVPDVVLCDKVSYLITNPDGNTIEISNFEYVQRFKTDYLITDVYTGGKLKLTKDNFKILCKSNEECTLTPIVKTYSS